MPQFDSSPTTTQMLPSSWRSFRAPITTVLAGALASIVGSCLPSPADAQLERLPPLTAEAAPPSPSARWLQEKQASSNIVQRGSVGLDALSPYNERVVPPQEDWAWHVMPAGLIYRAYLAGVKESRFASYWNWDRGHPLWDITLGGRASILRYGTIDPLLPHGFEVQIEGAAFPRLDPSANMDLQSVDFRFGVPLAYSHGPWEFKFAYYHLSSHMGDELMVHNNSLMRINYSRDALVAGAAYRWTPDLRLYGEAAWAFHTDGGARPWEFQFGAEYSPIVPTGFRPLPFFAVNGHLRQDVNCGGNFVAQAGLQWRGAYTGSRFRFGAEYFNGKSRQFEFFRQFEQQIGLALWYDY